MAVRVPVTRNNMSSEKMAIVHSCEFIVIYYTAATNFLMLIADNIDRRHSFRENCCL